MIVKRDITTQVVLRFVRAAKRRPAGIRARLLRDKVLRSGRLKLRLSHLKWELEQYY